jgi:LysM domain
MTSRPSKQKARRSSDVVRGLAALAGVVFLLFGVPLVLARLAGWPLPHAVPTVSSVVHGVTHELQVGHVVKALVVVCWLAWGALTFSILGELAALRTGRPPRHRRVVGPFQQFAARLVTSITLLVNIPLALGAVQPASALPLNHAPMMSVHAPAPSTSAATAASPTGSFTLAALQQQQRSVETVSGDASSIGSVVVQPRDSLHKIAEVHLGDAMRWREIWDLNSGNTMSDGSAFTRPELIRPGWILQLPGGPVGPVESVAVVPGDTLSGIAENRLGAAERWPAVFAANEGKTVAPGRHLTNPDHIEPGWRLALPTDSQPAVAPELGAVPNDVAEVVPEVAPEVEIPAVMADPAATAAVAGITPALEPTAAPSTSVQAPRSTKSAFAAASTSAPAGNLAQTASERRAADVADASDRTSRSTGLLGLSGATLLATGAATLLTARRRRRLRSMGPDHLVPEVDPAARSIAASLSIAVDDASIARIRRALRVLAADAAIDLSGTGAVVFDSNGANATLPTPKPMALIVANDGSMHIYLDHAMPVPPTPFTVGPTPEVLVLAAGADLADHAAADRLFDPCPGLVMIGTTADDERREVYVNLEAVGTLAVDGAASAVGAAIVRALVASLSVSPFADNCSVLTSGISLGAFAEERRVHSVESLAAVAALVNGTPYVGLDDEISELLGEATRAWAQQDSRPAHGRRAVRNAESLPLVVVAASGSETTQASLGRFVDRAGFAVITDAPLTTPWRLDVTLSKKGTAKWRLAPLGLSILPIGVSEADVDALAALLADAAKPPSLAAVPVDDVETAPYVDPDWKLLVRLLGSVDVVDRTGTAVAFERSKALELTAWLVEHRGAPLRSLARTALWSTNVADSTFHNVISDARRSMGRLLPLDEQADWISRHGGDRLDLHPSLCSDVELVRSRFEYARRAEAAAASAAIAPALAMIRDLPLVGTDYLWAEAEAIASSLTHLCTSVATVAARHALSLGDADAVFAATAVGLRVLSGHDDLVSLRMEAHALQGNYAGVRNEYASYEKALIADPWFDGEASPKVLATRARLLAPAAGPAVSAA